MNTVACCNFWREIAPRSKATRLLEKFAMKVKEDLIVNWNVSFSFGNKFFNWKKKREKLISLYWAKL